MKIDAVPGIDTSIRVTPNRIGHLPGGLRRAVRPRALGHARDRARRQPPGFDAWLADARARQAAEPRRRRRGRRRRSADAKALFATTAGCGACHTLADAGTTAPTGPYLDQVLKGKDAAFIQPVDRASRPSVSPKGYRQHHAAELHPVP